MKEYIYAQFLMLYNTGMFQRKFQAPGMLLLVGILLLAFFLPPTAHPVQAGAAPFNPYDLIGAVNALRAQYGLGPFNVDGSLMASAQAHSDYQASIQTMTHDGPGGSTPNDRAAAAGYPGRVSENIAVFTLGFDNPLSWVIYQAWADDLHMNTMINPQYLDVGAGIAVGGDRVYITLDAGWPSGSYPLPTHSTSVPAGTAGALTTFEPIFIATPLPDGSQYHIVGYGQSLLAIAGAYGVDVSDLTTLNNINPDQISAGQKLLIRPANTPTATFGPTDTLAPTLDPSTPTLSPTPLPPPPPALTPMRIAGMVIVALCIAGAALLLTGRRK